MRNFVGIMRKLAGAVNPLLSQGMDNETVVLKQIDAYNARDIETFLTYFDDKIICYRSLQLDPFVNGKADMRVKYAEMFTNSPGLHCHVANCISYGDFVIIHEKVDGHRGKTMEVAAINRVENGVITHVWFVR